MFYNSFLFAKGCQIIYGKKNWTIKNGQVIWLFCGCVISLEIL